MSLLMLMAAASALVPPQPPGPHLIAPEDFPGSVRNGRNGAVLVSLFTDPQGRPVDCDVERVVDADFSRFACSKIMAMRFNPAKDADGKPRYGYYRALINFWVPGSGASTIYPLKLTPDLAVSVKPAPGLTQTREIKVAAVIDELGNVSECAAMEGSGNAAMATAACRQLKAMWKDTPIEMPGREGRTYVRALTVAFVPEGATP